MAQNKTKANVLRGERGESRPIAMVRRVPHHFLTA